MSAFEIDHFVLTVADVERSVKFYRDRLGLPIEQFEDGRTAIRLSTHQKINLQIKAHPHLPIAAHPTFGSSDFCLMTDKTPNALVTWAEQQHLIIETGPVVRHGAKGTMTSLYVRDPDQNLVELAAVGTL
ncbi:VOC family protein [Furfurilactobacillus milii]|uniref:VOC family protein n=1 Tax=Furfurilactobacillus milii TaxID=2888272 RepID=A0A6N9I5V8_9LACO|nr:VOC family protein [Furfurilactobacillus milii]MYV18177.1 VOC family protein [Furfurilactobacillus milii]